MTALLSWTLLGASDCMKMPWTIPSSMDELFHGILPS